MSAMANRTSPTSPTPSALADHAAAAAAEGEPAPLVRVRLARRSRPVTVWAETTDNPDLVIVPDITEGPVRVQWAGWFLAHVPTGRALPLSSHPSVALVGAMGPHLADLDCSSSDPATYQNDRRYQERIIEASTALTTGCGCLDDEEEPEAAW